MDAPDREADRKDSRPGGGISLQTLLIASAASAVASFVASRIWGAGTLFSAAATPVIVALVAEFLRRPVQTVAETAKKVPTVQTLPLPGVHKRTFAAPGDTTRALDDAARASTDPSTQDEPQPPSTEPLPPGPDEPPGDEASVWRPRWQVVVVTGLLAFAIVFALYTVPDLIAGSSITGNGDATTFIGGSASPKKPAPTSTSTVTTVTTIIKTTPTTTTTQSTTTQSTSTATTTTTTATTPTTTTTTPTTTGTAQPAGTSPTTTTTPVP